MMASWQNNGWRRLAWRKRNGEMKCRNENINEK
jgi:hypothetical protein